METLSFFKAILLGAIQGATEFLPVSSSAHLVFAQALLNVRADGQFLVALDLALHLGTLLAVIVIFRQDLIGIVKGCLSKQNPEGRHRGWLIVVGTLPAVVVGGSLHNFFEALFSDVLWAGIFLCVTGFILWSTRRFVHGAADYKNLHWPQALKVGLAQAAAILPGISRSGSTIAAGIWCRLDPAEAARFSFLLSIPAIAGAFVLEAGNFRYFQMEALLQTLAGAVASFIVGYASIRWLLKIISRGHFSNFAIYCWIVGGLAILT